MEVWNETIEVVGALLAGLLAGLAALAWPLLAGTAIFIFKEELASLLKRIRKGAGLEFDPSQQPTEPFNLFPNTASGAPRLFPETKATRDWENVIRTIPPIEAAPDHTHKENLLIELAARVILIASFEQVEGTIWRSQIALLTHLKQVTTGTTLAAELQDKFYRPALERHPNEFSLYPYDRYINFLGHSSLITFSDERVSITDKGKEYLDWRISAKKHEKTFG